MLEVKHISKKRMLRTMLKDCSFSIETGKIVGIIGENGSGKTTLLKILAGVLHPSKGDINLEKNRSHQISYSPDQEYFYDYFKIEQLIDFYNSQFNDFDLERAKALIDFFELDPKQKITYLSKGQKTRVKIAVTIARNTPFLVLDEPLAGLDPLVKEKIINGLIRFVDLDKQSLIITTHELLEVEAILDEVIVLKDGQVIEQKEVEDIRKINSLQNWLKEIY
ncbi:ABC transporter ATP-binding protein [Gracilibacillus kekensis]|uniref:ABC-2 type transport system ATP-binding protein n=1 Tax=Gracilibacillus kekensis TaxID=1027249 RepID=A0A1M7MJ72_9BACI|nr:ABC transporter ATP-binding protein [Gracilibacillus kekensis]SHM90995.1 ABC-2 type transport system ATP-binding protein [Gracilibacillus kekensis]